MKTDALKTVPDIIKAASGTNLGILALLILVLALFGLVYFRKSGVHYQFAVFVLMFCGVAAFGVAAISVQREEALRTTRDEMERIQREAAETIKDLKLKLVFVGKEAANPYQARVKAYVQKKNESEEKPRSDIIQCIRGVGGIVVDFNKLAVGDKLYVEVEDGGKRWRSDDMQMLEAHLEMNPQRL